MRVGFCADFTALFVTLGLGCGSPAPPPNSFTAVYQNVIVPSCASAYCHYYNVGIRYSALDLSSRTIAYWNLVDQPGLGPSCSEMGTRVVPGRPSSSLLYQKIAEDMPPCGSRMPSNPTALLKDGTSVFSGTALTAEQQQLVYDWILAGAQND